MIWAYENNKMELFSILQEFFELPDMDYKQESESESEDDIESEGEPELLSVKKDKRGFLSLD